MSELLTEYPTDKVVVPTFSIAAPSALSKSAIVVDKINIETSPAAVRANFQALNADDAATISFYALKSRVADLKYGNVFSNLPNIKGNTDVFAFIDTDQGLISSDFKLLEQYNSFKRVFSDDVQNTLKDISESDLGKINTPNDLLK